ncbi:MAG: ABC transporter ATP-binding protein, partial [Bacteroidia bacterium]
MKTYLRILSYARPYKGKIALYVISILLSVIFAGLTFYMFPPLLDLLFNPNKVVAYNQLPEFSWSLQYLRSWVEFKATEISREHGKASA